MIKLSSDDVVSGGYTYKNTTYSFLPQVTIVEDIITTEDDIIHDVSVTASFAVNLDNYGNYIIALVNKINVDYLNTGDIDEIINDKALMNKYNELSVNAHRLHSLFISDIEIFLNYIDDMLKPPLYIDIKTFEIIKT